MSEPFFLKKKPGPKVVGAKPDVKSESQNKDNVVEIQILSAEPGSGLRYNLMKLNSTRDVDPSKFPRPLLMNRKQPGPKPPPVFQHDVEGNIIGRFVYDEQGKPVLDDEGKPVVEKKNEMDMSLVGAAPGQSNKRRGKRNTKEVFHQDVEVIKLRREEANPWVIEPKNPSDKPAVPEHWVGRMMEPSALPTILLINEGEGASFTMVPLGRTYKFESQRPFKVMDADQANKYFEMQAKYKVHDRWGQRQEDVGPGLVKVEETMRAQADRAQRMEWNIANNKGELRGPAVKREKFEDDYVREGRNVGRGLEGGVDEELDFDVNEDFQDDEDSNTFYFNKEEEEERKLQEERQKKEYRWANTNVGDRPQIEDDGGDDDDDDDLFGEKLNSEGRRLRKMMRKRGEEEGEMYDSSEDDDSSSDDDEDKAAKDKEKEKDRVASRAGSKAPDGRTGSPKPRSSAPPGSGAALLAKRAASASRGASPRPRASSPLVRGSSPVAAVRGSSPMGREGSPASTPAAGTPSAPKSKSAKRKASSQSPLPDGAPTSPAKRKSPVDSSPRATPPPTGSRSASSAPAGSGDGAPAPKKKKKARASSGSATPVPDETPFPGMIPREAMLAWLRSQADTSAIPMATAIAWAKPQLLATPEEFRNRNQGLFLNYIRIFTERTEKLLKLRAEYE